MQYWKFVQSHSETLWRLQQWWATKVLMRTGITEKQIRRPSVLQCSRQQKQNLHLFQRHCIKQFSYRCTMLSLLILQYKTHNISYLWLVLVKIHKALAKLMIPNDSCLQPFCKRACSMITWNWKGLRDNIVCKRGAFFHVLNIIQTFSDPQLHFWCTIAKQCYFFFIFCMSEGKKVKSKHLF